MIRPRSSNQASRWRAMSSRRGSRARPGKPGQHLDDVHDVVPHQGRLRLAEVGPHVEHVGMGLAPVGPLAQDRLRPAAGRFVTSVRRDGQRFEHRQIDEGARVILAPWPAPAAELSRSATRPAVLARQACQCLEGAAHSRLVGVAELLQRVHQQRRVAQRPGPGLLARAAVLPARSPPRPGRDPRRTHAPSPAGRCARSRVLSREPKIGQEGQLVNGVAGGLVAVQRRNRPGLQIAHERTHPWIGEHPSPGLLHGRRADAARPASGRACAISTNGGPSRSQSTVVCTVRHLRTTATRIRWAAGFSRAAAGGLGTRTFSRR